MKRRTTKIPVKPAPGKVTLHEIEIGGTDFMNRLDLATVKSLENIGRRHTKTAIEKVRKASAQVKEQVFGADCILPPLDMDALAEFGRVNTWHRCCCVLKAGVVAGLGWNTDDAPDDMRTFFESVNENQESIVDVLVKMQNDFEVFGNMVMEIVPTKGNTQMPAEMYHLPAHTLRPIADEKGFVYGYQQIRGGVQAYFKKWGIDPKYKVKNKGVEEATTYALHMMDYSALSDFYGEPQWLPAINAIALDISATAFNKKAFENDLIISFLLKVEGGTLGAEGVASLTNYLRNNFKGVNNARRALILESTDPSVKIGIEKISAEIKDASFRFLRQDNRDEVIAAHGVPPRLLGIMAASQLGGGGEGQQQLRIFKQIIVNPRQRRLEDIINKKILGLNKAVSSQQSLVKEKQVDDSAAGEDDAVEKKPWQFKLNELDTTVAFEDAQYYSMFGAIWPDLFTQEEIRTEAGFPAEKPKTKYELPAPQPFGFPQGGFPGQNDGGQNDPTQVVKQLIQLKKTLEHYRRQIREGS